MARGPYQGTWQQGIRPTVVTSPDAIVYLNGEVEMIGCPKCRRRFDWNKYITTIQVDLNVDSAPGSASFSLSIPRHTIDEFYFDGNPLITPMMEVEIYAKGYFLVEGLPQYYPIFWGIVTEVSDSYSGGEHTVSVNCADILKWWELCKININPAMTQTVGQLGRNIFGNVFFGTNPYDIIWTLAQNSFGDVIIGSGSLLATYREANQRPTFNQAMADLMMYWEQRFGAIRSNLLLYGTQGNAVRGDLLDATVDASSSAFNPKTPKKQVISQLVRRANGGEAGVQMVFDPTDYQVVAFRQQTQVNINFWQSEFQTKLELANAAKECIMDVDGSIVFKPPFYNLDVLSNKPTSWIQDIDIIDWDLSESEAEVVTQLQIQGAFGGNMDWGFGEEMTPATSVTDYHLLRKYGWRTETFNSEFMGSTVHMFYMGLDLLDRMNARRFRGTVNIPLRPELRLGFPIYLAPKDQVWYIQGISHNISFGGRAQTTLTLTAKRSKFIAPRGIGTIKLTSIQGQTYQGGTLQTDTPTAQQLTKGVFQADVGEAAELPPVNYPDKPGDSNPYEPLILRHPTTGRIVGYPNVVMAYTRPFAVPPDEFKKVAGRRRDAKPRNPNAEKGKLPDAKAANKQLQEIAQVYQKTKEDEVRERYLSNRFQYGLNSAGVFTYLYDQSAVIKELVLLPKSNVKFADESEKDTFQGTTAMIRPVSDERGFEVIGHYKYGRNVSLRDGSLVLNETEENPGALNSRAEVLPQPAIAGALYETLEAQSQGLVSRYTRYPNPAEAVSKLAPDGTDLQTAGIVNPETGKPEFVETAENFVNVAPLGSGAQKGTHVNVEASQLSRALTLTEMSVKDDIADAEACGCIMNRADLAFINAGYRVKVLTSTTDSLTGDDTSVALGFGEMSAEAAAIQERQTDVYTAAIKAADEALALAKADPNSLNETPEETQARFDRAYESAYQTALSQKAQEYGISTDQAAQLATEGATAADGPQPVAASVLSREEAISKVEEFLTGLYEVLDGPHQEYEKVLRGEFMEGPQISAQEVRFGRGFDPQDQGGFAPPFSTPERAHGGDLDAIAKAGSTARQDMEKAWNNLSNDLQANAKRAELEARKAQLEQEVAKLRAQIQDMERAAEADSGVIVTTGSELDDLKARLAEAEQELADVTLELRVHNQEYPP
jgi:hypothetical protein